MSKGAPKCPHCSLPMVPCQAPEYVLRDLVVAFLRSAERISSGRVIYHPSAPAQWMRLVNYVRAYAVLLPGWEGPYVSWDGSDFLHGNVSLTTHMPGSPQDLEGSLIDLGDILDHALLEACISDRSSVHHPDQNEA